MQHSNRGVWDHAKKAERKERNVSGDSSKATTRYEDGAVGRAAKTDFPPLGAYDDVWPKSS